MLREFLSGLTMNGPAMVLFLAQAKKAQERKLICERKRDAKRRFQVYVLYVSRRRFVSPLFLLLLTRNFFPLVPVRKIWAKLFKSSFWMTQNAAKYGHSMAFVLGNGLFINFTTENSWLIFDKTKLFTRSLMLEFFCHSLCCYCCCCPSRWSQYFHFRLHTIMP